MRILGLDLDVFPGHLIERDIKSETVIQPLGFRTDFVVNHGIGLVGIQRSSRVVKEIGRWAENRLRSGRVSTPAAETFRVRGVDQRVLPTVGKIDHRDESVLLGGAKISRSVTVVDGAVGYTAIHTDERTVHNDVIVFDTVEPPAGLDRKVFGDVNADFAEER